MTIRELIPEDFQPVFSMMQVFYASDALLVHPSDAVLAQTLQDAIAHGPYLDGFGFEAEGALIGYGMIAKSYSTECGGLCVWIEDIYILPPHRGKGYGTAFLKFVETRYKGAAVRIRLEAEPENKTAMAVYRRAGFERLNYTQLVKSI